MSPASRALAAGALEEAQEVGPVALHGAAEVVAEEASHAVGVATRRVEERDPSSVGPRPDGTHANAVGRVAVEHGNAGRVGAEQAWRTRLLLEERAERREAVDRDSDAAAERLRCDLDASALEAKTLPLDRLVLEVLVAERLDDEGVAELASRNELRGGLGRDEVIAVRTSAALDLALPHEQLRGLEVEHVVLRERHRRHLDAAEWTEPCLGRHARDVGDARQVRGEHAAPRMTATARTRRLLLIGRRDDLGCGRRGGLRVLLELQLKLPLEALERLRARALARQVRDALRQLRVEVAHPRDEREDGRDEPREAHRGHHVLEPDAHGVDVRCVRRGHRLALRVVRPSHDG